MRGDDLRAGLGRALDRLLAEHWPNSGVNPWYLADLLRENDADPTFRAGVVAWYEKWGRYHRAKHELRALLDAHPAPSEPALPACECPTDDYCPRCHPRWHAAWRAAQECCCESSPPEFGGNLPDRECPIHAPTPSEPEATVVEGQGYCFPSLGEPCGNCHRCADPTPAPSDLATLLAEHVFRPRGMETDAGCHGCDWKPPLSLWLGAAMAKAHRAHVAEVIEAAGWRQVAHPDGGPLISEPDNHHNAAVCPYCSPGYLSPEAVREREAAAWDAGYLVGWHDRNEDEVNPLPAGEFHDTANPYRSADR